MRKVAVFSTLMLLLLGLAAPSYAHGSWGGGGGWHGGGGWGWRGGGCCWGGGVFIGYGGYGGYGGYPYGYAPYYPPYPPYYASYPSYPPYPAYPGVASSTVTPSAPSPTSTVDPATVRVIQAELQRAGYDVGAVDGRLGPRTRAAIRQYEQQNGLPVDGSPSRALLDHLRSRSTG